MTGLVEAVRREIEDSCIEDGPLRRKDCEISLESAPQSRVVIDFDKPGSPLSERRRRCEYLFVADRDGGGGWVVPVEFKSGSMRVSKVADQLQAGARVAERLVPKGNSISFRPVAVLHDSVNKQQRRDLKEKRNRVRYRGRHEPVRVLRCGDLLSDVLGA